jgi:hypothetical protein
MLPAACSPFPRHHDRDYRDPVHGPAALWRGRGDRRHVVGGNRHFRDPGRLVGLIGANPIIVTIGAGAIQEGIIGWLSPGDITPPPGANIEFLARTIFGLPFSVYVFLGLALVLDLCMRHTRFGLEIYLSAKISRPHGPLACRSRCLPPRPLRSPASALR